MKKVLGSMLIALLGGMTQARADAGLLEPVMVNIPAGEYQMGGNDKGDPHSPGNMPTHAVKLKAFQLSKYEVTVAEYRQFAQETGRQPAAQCWQWARPGADGAQIKPGNSRWDAPPYSQGDYHPVVCVTHDDASAYARWLSGKTGKTYRLPSEAEWEYAARAGSTKEHEFGDKPAEFCKFANLRDQSMVAEFAKRFGIEMRNAPCDDGAAFTQTVGMYAPNAFGLHDMLGNASEWVADCQHPNYEGAPTDGSAWTQSCDTSDGPMFITRGDDYAGAPSVSARGHGGQTNASSLGESFRLALDGHHAVSPGQARLARAIEQARAQLKAAQQSGN